MKNFNVDFKALAVTVIYPILLIIMAVIYSRYYKIGTFEILCMVVTYYIINISVGVGLHRLWSHGAYKAKKSVEFVLSLLTAATLQGPILAWASDHMMHHQHTDEEKDPHTALKFKNKLVGFLWSHMGWMIFPTNKTKKIERVALVKLGRNKIVMWQFRNYWKIAILMNLLPLVIGYLIGGTVHYAISAFIFMGLGRAIQQQATFCVNSIVHVNMGTRQYYYGTANDIWWLFFMLLGENWHNFHHAFASDYRNGPKWYHLDIHKWVIALLAKCGLASDLVVTSKERIASMVEEVKKKTIADRNNKILTIEKMSNEIYALAVNKLKSAEKSATKFAEDFKENLNIVVEKSSNIIKNIQELQKENIEEAVLKSLSSKLEDLKKIAFKLGIYCQSA